MGHAIDNALDVACLQMVFFAYLDEILGSVNHQHVVTFALLAQNHDDGGNAGAEKDIGRQPDNGINMIVFNQIFTDFLFFTTPKKHAMWQDDGHDTVGF